MIRALQGVRLQGCEPAAASALESLSVRTLFCSFCSSVYAPTGEVLPSAVRVPAFWKTVSQADVPDKFKHTAYPEHYDSLPVIHASERSGTSFPLGSWGSRKLRRDGYVTGVLDSLPHFQEMKPLIYPVAEMNTLRQLFRGAFQSKMAILHIISLDDMKHLFKSGDEKRALYSAGWRPSPLQTYQVIPRRVHVHPTTDEILNVTVMNCPSDRVIKCTVPIELINEDLSECVRKGGQALITKQTVTMEALATNIPLFVPVDCTGMESGAKASISDLPLAEGQYIVGAKPDMCVVVMEGGKKAVL